MSCPRSLSSGLNHLAVKPAIRHARRDWDSKSINLMNRHYGGANHEDTVYEWNQWSEESRPKINQHSRFAVLTQNSRSYEALARQTLGDGTSMPLMSSSSGTVLNHVWHSAGVVLRYRLYLEGRGLAPGTINVRLAAVRRLAYEAADAGLLSPELAAGIHRVKGVRNLGSRLGNWLTAEEVPALWQLRRPSTYGKTN